MTDQDVLFSGDIKKVSSLEEQGTGTRENETFLCCTNH
jgi:hypothetical protein